MIKGEVWDIHLGETFGDEITGRGPEKTRPAVNWYIKIESSRPHY